MDVSCFMVPTCPRTVLYIPNFITSNEEAAILAAVDSAPKPKWQQLSNRRLINYGGVPHPKGMLAEPIPDWLRTYVNKVNSLGIFDKHPANHVLVNEYLPGQGIMPHTDGPLFHPVISTISCGSHTVLEFTGMPPQTPPTSSSSSTLTVPSSSSSASLSAPAASAAAGAVPARRRDFKLLVERRSLLVLQDDMYSRYMHAIGEKTVDKITDAIANLHQCCDSRTNNEEVRREKRISLTIRHVPRTSKMTLQFGTRK